MGADFESTLQRQLRYQVFAYSNYYRQRFEGLGIGADDIDASSLLRLGYVDRETLASNIKRFFLRPTRKEIQKWGAGSQVTEVLVEMIVRGAQRSENLVRSEYERVHTLRTAGVQGEPIAISLSKYDLVELAKDGKRMLEVAGIGPNDVLFNFLEGTETGGFWPAWLGGVEMGLKQTASGRVTSAEAHRVMSDGRATAAIMRAEDALVLVENEGFPVSVQTLLLAPGGEQQLLRERITQKAYPSMKILGAYYFAEGRGWRVECAQGGAGSGFHSNSDYELLEVVADDPSAPRPGQPGEIAFTGLDQRGTALVRYRPGDRVGGVVYDPCPHCGRSGARVVGPIHRTGEMLELTLAGRRPFKLNESLVTGVLGHPDLDGWRVEIQRNPNDYQIDDVFVFFDPRDSSNSGRVAVELDMAFRTSLGFVPTQFVMSDRADGQIVDLRL